MARRSVAIYQDTPNGRLRLGLFPAKPSLRETARAFHARHPNAVAAGPLYIVPRQYLCGKWVDGGEFLPMDPPERAVEG